MQIFRADALSNPLPIWKQNYCILLHFKHFAFTSNFLPPFLPSSLLSSFLSSTPTAPPSLPLF